MSCFEDIPVNLQFHSYIIITHPFHFKNNYIILNYTFRLSSFEMVKFKRMVIEWLFYSRLESQPQKYNREHPKPGTTAALLYINGLWEKLVSNTMPTSYN